MDAEEDKTHAGSVIPRTGRRVAFDYLRATAIVLVVYHHAIIPYTTFAYLNPLNPVQTISPVVNGERWSGFDTFAWFNDIFLMSLLFLVSGLFVWKSLTRKGAAKYLSARVTRLGIPFLVGVLLLVAPTYYPAQLQISQGFGGDIGFVQFYLELFRVGFGTAGPLWFVWVLLAFNGLFVAAYKLLPIPARPDGTLVTSALARPVLFFATLLAISAAAYGMMVIMFGPLTWIGVGPFKVQASRSLHYLVYFLAGVAVGAYGIDRSVFRADGPLATYWWAWLSAAVVAFLVAVRVTDIASSSPFIGGTMFTICCVTIGAAFIATFLRFANRRRVVLDSLSDNSFGIYIVHYLIAAWLQYFLLGPEVSPFVKASLAFVGTLVLSWAVTAALRRIPAVARVI
ncbi:MAG: acyltransferase [Rhodothermales bacterium]|nr:acyltransferase [Rhodothermales bacterium]